MSYSYQSIYFDDPIIQGRCLDIMLPERRTRNVSLFFVHGGGWRSGARATFHKIMRAFNREGFIGASTDYRLAGVTIFEQLTDVRHGYDIFLRYLHGLRREKKLFVIGSSAGAHLAALLILARPGECSEKKAFGNFELKSWIRPVAGALQSTPVTFEPWEDIFPHVWTAMQDIAGADYKKNPSLYKRVSPIRCVRRDSPPIFFLEAENEHMFPLALTKQMIARMRKCGVKSKYKVYAGAEHGFFYDVTRRQQKEAFRDILNFIESLE